MVEWVRGSTKQLLGLTHTTLNPLIDIPYYGSLYPDHYIVGLVKERGRTKYVVYGIPSMYSMILPYP